MTVKQLPRYAAAFFSIVIFVGLYWVLSQADGLAEIRILQNSASSARSADHVKVARINRDGGAFFRLETEPGKVRPSDLKLKIRQKNKPEFITQAPGTSLPDNRYAFTGRLGGVDDPLLRDTSYEYRVVDNDNTVIEDGDIHVTVYQFEKRVSTPLTVALASLASLLQILSFFWTPAWKRRLW